MKKLDCVEIKSRDRWHRLEPAENLIEKAIQDRLFPGCALSISINNRIFFSKGYGRLTYAPWTEKISGHKTLFDLASLTKPLATSCAFITLADAGRIDLDRTLGELLAPCPGDKKEITVRQLLSHCAGLPAHVPFYKKWSKQRMPPDSATICHDILAVPLQYPPGRKSVYSDLGFILAALLLENITHIEFHEYVEKKVFSILDANDILFPEAVKKIPAADVVPTGLCTFAKRMIWGEVNDTNARAMGRLAGHAGLFGTACGVNRMLGKLLHIWKGRLELPGFKQKTVKTFLKRQNLPPGSTWALGFDTPSRRNSSAGHFFAAESVGHLGFTGTSFWIDPDRELIMVFLANRTFPEATPESQDRMKKFRPLLHDTISEVLTGK